MEDPPGLCCTDDPDIHGIAGEPFVHTGAGAVSGRGCVGKNGTEYHPDADADVSSRNRSGCIRSDRDFCKSRSGVCDPSCIYIDCYSVHGIAGIYSF